MKVAFLYNAIVNYFFFKNSSTASGVIIDSTNVYAPVLGDFTILMAFDNLLEDVCKDATVFFAMIQCFCVLINLRCQTSKIILKSLIII